jgi:hypothetical protein
MKQLNQQHNDLSLSRGDSDPNKTDMKEFFDQNLQKKGSLEESQDQIGASLLDYERLLKE